MRRTRQVRRTEISANVNAADPQADAAGTASIERTCFSLETREGRRRWSRSEGFPLNPRLSASICGFEGVNGGERPGTRL